VQALLGEIHDCDVWLESLPRLAEEERRRTLEYFGDARPFAHLKPGLVALQEERRAARARAYAELVVVWDRLAAARFWERLRRLPGPPRTGGQADLGAEAGTLADHRELA
jgi:hypothetical protein